MNFSSQKHNPLLTIVMVVLFSMLLCWETKSMPQTIIGNSNRVKNLYEQAKVDYLKGDYDSSLQNLQEVLWIKNQSQDDINPEYFKVYNRLGIVHKKRGNLQAAIGFYKKATKYTCDDYYLAALYKNIANVFSLTGDFSKTFSYLDKSLNLSLKSKTKDFGLIADIYHNLGYSYYNSGNPEKALHNYKKSIQARKKHNLDDDGETFYCCGLVYQELDSLEKAEGCFKRAIESNVKKNGDSHYITAMSYMYQARFYADIEKYNESEKLFEKAYKLLFASLGEKHLFTSYCHKYQGDMYYGKGKYEKALKYYQKALISKYNNFNNTSIYANPEHGLPDLDLIEVLKSKAKALEALSKKEDYEHSLQAALKTLETTAKFIERLKSGYLSEKSKLELLEKEYETFIAIIRIAHDLYNLSGDSFFAEKVFKYAELGKYSVLRDSKNEYSARLHAGVPDSISFQDRELKTKINTLRFLIERENKMEYPNTLSIKSWNEELFELNKKREEIVTALESEYPEYYKQKKKSEVISVPEIKTVLQKDEAIIEYVLSDSLLFSLFITKSQFRLKKQRVDSTFYLNLEFYTKFLNSNTEFNYDSFRISAYYLYQHLLSPFDEEMQNKKLLIVPDGKLSLIAFEALVDEPLNEELWAIDYREEPYIIRKYPIGYAFSATLYAGSLNQKRKIRPRFLGFAPDYSISADTLKSLPMSMNSLRRISRILIGKKFMGKHATKENFKKHYKGYDILHFYVHGYGDNLSPSQSKIFFFQDSSYSGSPGILYAFEVKELNGNAQLVVLPSCYSGYGVISRGEGVLSLGRSFIDAGNASIVMSLWGAFYKPTIFELEQFYKQLLMGRRKDVALQKAKLKYLKESDPMNAHPQYWSSIIVVGNQAPLFYRRIMLFLGIIPVTFTFIVIMLKRKKRRVI